MAVTDLKRAACDALAAYIATYLTAQGAASLAANCKAIQSDEETTATFPSLRVLPDTLRFEPNSMDVTVDDTQDNHVTLELGVLTGTVELRLGFRSPAERSALETLVLASLFQDEDRRGTVVVPITGGLTLPGGTSAYEPACGFTLDDEEWVEEKVFEKKRYASLYLEADFPLLVLRSVVGDMTTLLLAFTQDLTTPAAEVETTGVVVHDDGSITPA